MSNPVLITWNHLQTESEAGSFVYFFTLTLDFLAFTALLAGSNCIEGTPSDLCTNKVIHQTPRLLSVLKLTDTSHLSLLYVYMVKSCKRFPDHFDELKASVIYLKTCCDFLFMFYADTTTNVWHQLVASSIVSTINKLGPLTEQFFDWEQPVNGSKLCLFWNTVCHFF